jgi:uncharacterized protein
LGNIKDKGLEELKDSDVAARFINESRCTDPECSRCKWYRLCRGGCRRSREPFWDSRPVLNYYCSSYREFFVYAIDRLLQLTDMFMGRSSY